MSNTVPEDPAIDASDLPWSEQNARARRATLTRILVRISQEALQGDNLESILQGICQCIVAELPVAIASVLLLDEANTRFIHEVYSGQTTFSPLATDGDWPVDKGAAGRCARRGRPQLIADIANDSDYVPGNNEVRSEYLVPIYHRRRLHGVLNIESVRIDFLDAEACAVFDAVAGLVAGAIHFARLADELAAANRKLEQLSMSDGLTGIANRRCFDLRLHADWTRLAGERRPLALLMVDADAFKPLNDARGHLYGDECLCELARICTRFADGGTDLVARYGGEELVLLLPGRDGADASVVAESLRAAIEAAAMPHPDSPVAKWLTVSIGVGATVPDAGRPPELLVAAADRALYAAKRAGRNRVCEIAGDDTWRGVDAGTATPGWRAFPPAAS